MSERWKRFWTGLVATLLAVAVVAGLAPQFGNTQSVFPSVANNSFTGTMAAAAGVVTITTEGRGGCAVVLTGTWVGTVTPQVSIDGGTTYVAAQFYNILTRTVTDNTTANGSFVILGVGGCSHARVNMTAYTSGTATAVIRSTSGGFSLPDSRDITVVKAIVEPAGALTADLTIWTPASGKKMRIFGVSILSTADTTITLNYGTTPTKIAVWPLQTGISERDLKLDFGQQGFLVDTADATAYIVRGAATILGGSIWGREE